MHPPGTARSKQTDAFFQGELFTWQKWAGAGQAEYTTDTTGACLRGAESFRRALFIGLDLGLSYPATHRQHTPLLPRSSGFIRTCGDGSRSRDSSPTLVRDGEGTV